MAVSKRTRFEVLRRDEYRCRYCRSTENPLTVDHVIPVALGGKDDPANLVAACKDCNAGKSSSAPDSSLVAEVRDEALRHAEVIRQAYSVLRQRLGERSDYIEEFAEAFPGQTVPQGWRASVGRWHEMGVPIELLINAAEIALGSPKSFTGYGRFSYLCGIVWNQVHAVNEAIETKESIEGAFMSEDELVDVRCESYMQGHDRGSKIGRKQVIREVLENGDHTHRLLVNVIEGSHQDFRDAHDERSGALLDRLRRGEVEEVADPWRENMPASA